MPRSRPALARTALCLRRPCRRASLPVTAALLTLVVCGCSAASDRSAGPPPSTSSQSAARPAEVVARGAQGARGPVWISQLQMISARAGWAVLWTGNPDASAPMQLGRTTDGGRTWRVVTPSGSPALAGTDLVLTAATADRAWLAVAGSTSADGGADGTTVVFGTDDGGRTWRRSQPLPGSEVLAMNFAGRSRGWLLESFGAAMNQNPVKLYGTSDAGERWSPLAKSGSVAGPPRVSRLTAACDKTGLRFESSRLGWITAACPVPADAVLATSDGGAHWTPVSLPAVAGACQQAGCEIPAPEIAGRSVFLVISAYPATAYLLVSTDHGLTWRVSQMPAGAGPYPRATFFTARDGLAVSAWSQGRIGRDFFITTNGGLSWTAVRQGLRFGGNWDDFDFVSQRTGFGWTYPAAAPSAALPLFQTSDSGRIWISFIPHLS